MDDYRLSAHAERVIDERAIRVEWLEHVLATPDSVRVDEEQGELVHLFGAIEAQGGRVLHVVVNRTANPRRIITAFFDRRARRDQ